MLACNTIPYKSPVGDILISATGDFITQLYFVGGSTTPPTLAATTDTPSPVLQQAVKQLDLYFDKKLKNFTLPLKPAGTDFRQQVWQALCQIPYGQTITYKQLAINIHNPKAIRAVGGANNHNPISIIIPCHRVIGASGKLVGYAGGLAMKKYLLELESNTNLN